MASKVQFLSVFKRHLWTPLEMSQDKNLLKYFLGLWTFKRKIESLKDESLIAEVDNGVASFCEMPMNDRNIHQVLYREKGQLKSDNFYSDFTRQYFYMFQGCGDIEVFHCSPISGTERDWLDPSCQEINASLFEKGDLFHDLKFKQDESAKTLIADSCKHFCGQDVYDGGFEIISEHNFEMQWKVTGPQKCFTIKTWFSRSTH